MICEKCGKNFNSSFAYDGYCPNCTTIEKMKAPKTPPKRTAECRRCGKIFVQKYNQKYCTSCRLFSTADGDNAVIQSSMDNINEMIKEADKMGMSYGYYMAWRRKHGA